MKSKKNESFPFLVTDSKQGYAIMSFIINRIPLPFDLAVEQIDRRRALS